MQEKQNLLLFNVYVGWKQRKDKQMMFLLLGKQEKKKDEEDQVGRLLRTSWPNDFLTSVNLKGDMFSAIT